MFQKVTTVALIGTALALAACNTVRGAAQGRQFGRKLHRKCDERQHSCC